MKKYRDSIKTIAVLAIIALASGLLLSAINSITQVDPNEVVMKTIEQYFPDSGEAEAIDLSPYKSLDKSEMLFAFLMESGEYIFVSHSKEAYSGYGLDMLIVIKDNKIEHLLPYHSEETPGIGSKVVDAAYLDKYIGIDVMEYSGTQLAGENSTNIKNIDKYTGATMSSNGVSNAVNGAIYLYRQIIGIEE